MIFNDSYLGYRTLNTTNRTAEQLAKQMSTADKLKKAKAQGDVDPDSFASKLKHADEYAASGEHHCADDSIGIMLRQMDEPTAGNPVTKDFWHNGAHVSICKDAMYGNSITIGGSSNPDWIHVDTSVGTVHVDLNDMTSLMKCLDLFSPEDLNAILRKIQEVKQAREAMNQIDRMQDELVKNGRDQEKDGEEGDGDVQSVGEAGAESKEQNKVVVQPRTLHLLQSP